MTPEEKDKLLEEHQQLRRLVHSLDVQSAMMKRRLAEIEVQIPDFYSGETSQEHKEQ